MLEAAQTLRELIAGLSVAADQNARTAALESDLARTN
jgi:hypothetical protein